MTATATAISPGRQAATADYEPLDLEAHRNGPGSLLAGEPPLGEQQFRGLPFHAGSGEHTFLVPATPITIAVGQAAHTVVFAHRLLDSGILRGGPVGIVVAEYIFELANGERLAVPI